MNAAKETPPPYCRCRRPARKFIAIEGIHSGRPYFICSREECDFFRFGDVDYTKKEPVYPNLVGTPITTEEFEEKNVPVWEQTVFSRLEVYPHKNRLQMKEVEGDFMVHLLEDFQQDTSTLWGLKKV